MLFTISLSLTACGQNKRGDLQSEPSKNQLLNNNPELENMDLSKITNENVKKAIEALQANDKNAWYAYFTDNATFTDDGRTLDFKSFFDNAFAHQEKFLTIDKVKNDSKDIYGNFYAGQWGTFKVYFKFHLNSEGKFERLDIGQTRY
ncbi:nuclear transport factor 2 family protein [Chryseobacterium oryctis]|uniref:Nuclear transport factor 2 family protein n=1 Tax=Chryseobacterium oryctis TaxID=2952618 RepID=A0ABT3HRV4_9FLAO|nr:nuclear transport factor 2 family protein [Chryseobacterium oryctis]MCW3162479.1 nuclear transport factor 2 family protein [Chryseobacterium oryctis]